MVFVNAAFERLTGYAAVDLIGRNCRMLQVPETDRETVSRLSVAVRQGVEHRCVLLNARKDGSPWWNELHLSPVYAANGRLTHYLGFQNDVSARVEAEQQLLHLAGHDALTGLANRATLLEQLDQARVRSERDGRGLAVLFFDLDGFKQVNDTLGHAVGDSVLVQATRRLRGALRANDLLARHGGDEFVAVLADLDLSDAERVGLRVATTAIEALQRPARDGEVQASLSASVGIALSSPGLGSEDLLRLADTAMYDAKATGRGAVRVSCGPTWPLSQRSAAVVQGLRHQAGESAVPS
jgi:diguanylate cyclase (GGDEF)-like protein/PAS domain S-box-containing protein